MDDKILELQNEAIEAATAHIRNQRKENENYKNKIVCLTIIICVLIISASVLGCFFIYSQQQTIIEQQYALNMQYSELMDYVSNAEVITETVTNTAESDGDGSVSVAGDNNITAGGDINGE